MIRHPFKPVYDINTKILILGSFPSVISRNRSFYYANKNNRFWKIMNRIFCEDVGDDNDSRIDLLLRHNIGLWDVIESCDIKGSSDSSITNVKVNNIKSLTDNSKIKIIITNGKKAEELYRQYVFPILGIESINLPSTSSANTKYSLDDISGIYKQVIMNTIDSHMNR